MFTVAVFTIASIWRLFTTAIYRWMDKEDVESTYKEILLSHKKEQIWVSGSEVNEARAFYTEWSKLEREKQILYINAYTWNLERWYDEPICRAEVETQT